MPGATAGTGVASMVIPAISIIAIVVITAVVVVAAVKLLKKNAGDRKYPVLMVAARVASKRSQAGEGTDLYFVTFQLSNDAIMELQVKGEEYGQLAEGDQGKVTFQGSEFVSFIEMGNE